MSSEDVKRNESVVSTIVNLAGEAKLVQPPSLELLSICKSLVAGGAAHGVSRNAVAPLERLRILLQASPSTRRMSLSPGRRLSNGVKGDSSGKKKLANIDTGISKVSEALVGSSKGNRKNWDESPGAGTGSGEQKEKGGFRSKPNFQAILQTQEAISRRLSDVSLTQHNQDDSSGFENSNPNLGEGSFVVEKSSNVAPVIAVHENKWADGNVLLDSISSQLAKLGKDSWTLCTVDQVELKTVLMIHCGVNKSPSVTFIEYNNRRGIAINRGFLCGGMKIATKMQELNMPLPRACEVFVYDFVVTRGHQVGRCSSSL